MAEGDFLEVAAYHTQDEAKAAARQLIEAGIASDIAKVTVADEDTGIEVSAYQLNVLGVDRRRAAGVLGLAEVPAEPVVVEGEEVEEPPLEKGPVPWGPIILIWLLAMIIIPTMAFFLTVWLSS